MLIHIFVIFPRFIKRSTGLKPRKYLGKLFKATESITPGNFFVILFRFVVFENQDIQHVDDLG